eukprot:gnl/TRDRNA2_/TRDRNA2_27529_c0_seq1.p1 gnl/TRDRNA2_/TRDRNA2_27529_c0~~gnl/TRDRNA2_/TRDRNA2_27529_c0_seq1.p1  ORF type:complete len:402 (+),score=70.51 gnl/TRDRNA2_/TRDRNA2_27529_c0_seq1:119-1207(+)
MSPAQIGRLFVLMSVACRVGAELSLRKECRRDAKYKPARRAWMLNKTFMPIMNGEYFSELSPKVLSVDPWVIYFENFMTEDEVTRYEKLLSKVKMIPSRNQGQRTIARTSETAICGPLCGEEEINQLIEIRVSAITGVPQENFEWTQATLYKPGAYFREHHDENEEGTMLPPGPRLYTIFVYLSEAEEGGGTRFTSLDISVPNKRGSAVLFANTKDSDPMKIDHRTTHEAIKVVRGAKRGANFWVHQYNWRDYFWQGCTDIGAASADNAEHWETQKAQFATLREASARKIENMLKQMEAEEARQQGGFGTAGVVGVFLCLLLAGLGFYFVSGSGSSGKTGKPNQSKQQQAKPSKNSKGAKGR